MIKLFEFQEKTVRTEIIDNQIWFNGKDVYDVLSITWRGGNGLRTEKNVPSNWILERGIVTSGGLQKAIFISEQALYKIVFNSKPKNEEIAKKISAFTDWVANLLVKIRKTIESGNESELKKHLLIDVQKDYSKKVNSKNFSEGGIAQTIEYNYNNCVIHTGMTTKEVKSLGKQNGLKTNQTSSAKEVLRNLMPEVACSMSLTDRLVSEDGVEHNKAAKVCKQYATPLFDQLLKLGLNQKELE